MRTTTQRPPAILFFAGSDPTGGAGIQADIMTCTAHRCHPLSVITALTAQNTKKIHAIWNIPPTQVAAQVHALLEEFTPCGMKISLLGHADNVAIIIKIMRQFPHIPLLVDPILVASCGDRLTPHTATLFQHLWPFCTLITPNILEAQQLSGCIDPLDCAQQLLDQGCQSVLITGTHDPTSPRMVTHGLYEKTATGLTQQIITCSRLAGTFHGSGCTLATAIISALVDGYPLHPAIERAQSFCNQSMHTAYYPHLSQSIPCRFHFT